MIINAPRCSACTHPKRGEIDRALGRGMNAGDIVRRYGGLTLDAIRRHAAGHPSDAEYAAAQEAKKARADALQREAAELAEAQQRSLHRAYGVRP